MLHDALWGAWVALLFDPRFFAGMLWGYWALGAATLLSLFVVTAPYGRHERTGWGPPVNAKVAWVFMESPALVLFIAIYSQGQFRAAAGSLALFALWQLHYVQRTLVYPLLLQQQGRPLPLAIPVLGFLFNVLNSYVNATWIASFHDYGPAWPSDPRFVVGAALFLAGFAINVRSDAVLRGLRRSGGDRYAIPRGFLYEWVSCPNYLGEILEWTGWAIATWSMPGLAFAFYTVANLLPRALANHRWYREKFPDYPRERRALVPFLL